jgi:hypothetical protein
MRVLRRRLFQIAGALVAVYALLTAGLFWAMCQPVDRFTRIMAHVPGVAFAVLPFVPLWNAARGGDLEIGDPAPDFTLDTTDGTARVRLSSFRGRRPVVLVFGSYT